MNDLNDFSLSEIIKLVKSKKISSLDLANHFINNIKKGKKLNSYITTSFEQTIKDSKNFDKKQNFDGLLPGIPIAVKDLFCTKNIKTTAGSKILENFVPTYESTVTSNLWKEGAILLGKLNCDEFAMGSTNENSAYGAVLNPVNTKYVAGGSSGGSAAAVAADLCLASLGSDTGGSIRQPASFCGVMGYKPSYGRVSRWGLIAYASSFDQIGPFTHNAEDAALLMEVMAGSDEHDSTCSEKAVPKYSQKLSNDKTYTIGYIKETLESPALDHEVKIHILDKIKQLKATKTNIKATKNN